MRIFGGFRLVAPLCLAAAFCLPAFGGDVVNGNFEAGNASGWTIGGGYRGGIFNNVLDPNSFLPGGPNYVAGIASSHSGIVTPGLDPLTGNQLNRVYSGNYSWRVEDTVNGGYASVASQTVTNYTKPNFFFAWAAVLEGAHGPTDAATVIITLRDLTANSDLITRQYNAGSGGGGVDSRFSYNASTNFYWTHWQVEQLALPSSASGHDLRLTILAADCEPTGHAGYLYLDGFGDAPPGVATPTVPTLSQWGIVLLIAGMIFVAVRALRMRAA